MAEESKINKLKAYIKTPKGKILAIVAVALLVVLLVVVVGVAFVFYRQVSGLSPEEPKPQPAAEKKDEDKTTEETGKAAAPEEEAAAPTEEAEEAEKPAEDTEVGVFEVYEGPRDPFQPLAGTGAGTGGTGVGAEQPSTAPGTGGEPGQELESISLENIYSSGGAKYASIKYGGKLYQVKEGDRVGETALQVISIYESSVVLLYGDERITLQLGQEVRK